MNVSPRAARQLQHFDQTAAAAILDDLTPTGLPKGAAIMQKHHECNAYCRGVGHCDTVYCTTDDLGLIANELGRALAGTGKLIGIMPSAEAEPFDSSNTLNLRNGAPSIPGTRYPMLIWWEWVTP